MVKVATADEESNERGNVGPWEADIAREAALRFLTIFDNVGVALFLWSARAESITPHQRAARAEALGIIGGFVKGARGALIYAARQSTNADEQRAALDNIRLAAIGVRQRIALLSPDTERGIRQDPCAWDAPPAHNDELLNAVERVHAGEAIELIAYPVSESAAAFNEHVEFNEHFARIRGGNFPATPSRTARLFAGVSALIDASSPPHPPSVKTRGECWKALCEVAMGLHRDRHPLARLFVFVDAVLLAGVSGSVIVRDGELLRIPRLVELALQLEQGADDRDGPKELVRAALRALGHSVAEFTNAERATRRRRKEARQSEKATAKPAHDARKRRAKTP